MIDLMNPELGNNKIPETRKTYLADGYQAVLCQRVKDYSLFCLTSDTHEQVDLNNNGLWRQKKVKEKAVRLFEQVANGRLTNRVLQIAFKLLQQDGVFIGGGRGTLFNKLLEEGYSVGTAHAQAQQIITLCKLLRITVEINKYNSSINKNSLLLPKVMQCLN